MIEWEVKGNKLLDTSIQTIIIIIKESVHLSHVKIFSKKYACNIKEEDSETPKTHFCVKNKKPTTVSIIKAYATTTFYIFSLCNIFSIKNLNLKWKWQNWQLHQLQCHYVNAFVKAFHAVLWPLQQQNPCIEVT